MTGINRRAGSPARGYTIPCAFSASTLASS
ncbi:hypothetical protein CI41S_49170 [Bradyrhizobium ivorense]|nr:hypothetical protein CI41S_49170 [Bradyrhizobium ivorense]